MINCAILYVILIFLLPFECVPVFRISPDFRKFVYCTAIRNGGIEEWEFALGFYEKNYGVWVSMEKDKLLYGMACTGQPWIQRKWVIKSISGTLS